MKIEEMEPEHFTELKNHLSTYDNVIDVQMVGYLDMYGDGSREYILYIYDELAKCFVISKFEYFVTKKVWVLDDITRINKKGEYIHD